MSPRQITLAQNTHVGELCKSLSKEEDSFPAKLLSDEFYRETDECELLASLL
jgi:hypothetical protein